MNKELTTTNDILQYGMNTTFLAGIKKNRDTAEKTGKKRRTNRGLHLGRTRRTKTY